jgi:acyl-CoA synthetase (AMP-forming)/AMP-acid ligase II
MDGTEVRIRNRDGAWLSDGHEGEICVRGPSVSRGCLAEEGIVPMADGEGWLATGDLGFVDGGELCVTGRSKDLIIVGGRNFHPQELESAAAGVPGFRPGRVVALGISDQDRATEALVVVAETDETDPERAAVAVAQLRQRLLEGFGVVPHDTVLVKRGAIPLTTSGKLRRSQARAEYESDTLRDVVFRILSAPHPAPIKQRRAKQAQRKAPLR